MPEPSELLREAADDLENLTLPTKARFDMERYGTHKGEHYPPEQNYCGTVACALGWLSTMKKWQDRGIKADWTQMGKTWHLDPPQGKDWGDLSVVAFGDELGPLVQDYVFEQMTFSREDAIQEMRELAKAYDITVKENSHATHNS